MRLDRRGLLQVLDSAVFHYSIDAVLHQYRGVALPRLDVPAADSDTPPVSTAGPFQRT